MWALLSISVALYRNRSVKCPIITQTVAVLVLLSTGTMDQSNSLNYPAKATCNRSSEQNCTYKNKIKQ